MPNACDATNVCRSSPLGERLDQAGVLGQVRHDAHLDLGVVGRQQALVVVADDERAADLAALGRADRDVLQVGVLARQPAGRRDGLVERRVHPAAVVDHRDQRVDDGLEPRHVAVPQQLLEQRVLALLGQPLQRIGVGRVAGLDPLRLRQPQLVEEHLLQLLRRAQVELVADGVVRRLRNALDLAAEPRLEGSEVVDVGGDAGDLHRGEHVDERQLHVAQQPGAAAAFEVDVECIGELGDGVGAHDLGAGCVHLVRAVE